MIFILFGLTLAAGLTIQGNLSQQMVVHPIWRELLQSSTDQYLSDGRSTAEKDLSSAGIIRGWRLNGYAPPPDMPPYFASLDPGYHDEHQMDSYDTDRSHAVLVTPLGNERIVMSVDITDLENHQNMTALLSVLMALLSSLMILGAIVWVYRTLRRPLQLLAQRMDELDPEQPALRLATDFDLSELHDIAVIVNRHLDRVGRFIERERSLLDLASHEFRTPVSVIAGAVDVIKLYKLPAETDRPLARIESTIGNLMEIMSALLFLSREPDAKAAAETTRLDAIIVALVDDHAHLLNGTGAAFVIEEFHPATVACPEAMVRIVVSNLLRNATEHGNAGPIRICLADGRLSIRNSSGGFDVVEAARRHTMALRDSSKQGGGQGLGLFITRRICERFGWTLILSSAVEGEILAQLHFGQAAPYDDRAEASGQSYRAPPGSLR
ncbi:HAMP domain-containing histidine kinase [Pseudomonas sp. Z1-29]|uniref:sensor histidine kinase n=1 Tax=unclassified Pseudomonas TaxID=196821 RepID=UPI003DAA08FE